MSLDVAMCALNLSSAPLDVITAVLATMELKQRFTCALVCRAWAKAAAAATRALTLDRALELSGSLKQWLEKYGHQLENLSLSSRQQETLTSLSCAQLQDLELAGGCAPFQIGSRVWSDIAAATRLTSVVLSRLYTESTPAEVLSVLARLPDLKRLIVGGVARYGQYFELEEEDTLMLQQLTQLMHLDVCHVQPSALRDIVMLGQQRSLVMYVPPEAATFNSFSPPPWPSINCSEVPGLTALTNLELSSNPDIPPPISQMTALQQLKADMVSLTALHQLSVLPALTRIQMGIAPGYTPESAPPQLPAMQVINWYAETERQAPDCLSMSLFDGCPQLQKLRLGGFYLSLRGDSPGSWVASSTLQHLDLNSCSIVAAEGDAGPPVPWQQVFTAPGQMGELTSLQFPCGDFESEGVTPPLADGECLVDCCSRLQVLRGVSPEVLPALVRLPHLTHLGLTALDDFQCSSLVQLTGLQELHVDMATEVTTAGLRQLAGLQLLASISFDKLHPDICAPAMPMRGSMMYISWILDPSMVVSAFSTRPHAAPHLMWRHSCCGSVMQRMLEAVAEALPGGLLCSDDGHDHHHCKVITCR